MVHYLHVCSPFSGDDHIWLLAKYTAKHKYKHLSLVFSDSIAKLSGNSNT